MGADAGVRLRFGILSTEIEPRRAAALSPLYFFFSHSLFLSFSFYFRLYTSIRARPRRFLPSKSSLSDRTILFTSRD